MRPGAWASSPGAVVHRRAVAFALLAAPVLFFPRVFLMGQIFLQRDLFNWFYPWRVFAARSLAAGDFPLWNPHSYMGTPFLGNMQSALLYPLNVFFWLLEFPAGLRGYVWAQCALASWLMYRLLRALTCGRAASLAGAFAWAYGGWMLVHIEFPNKLGAAAWLPLIVWGMVLVQRGRITRGVALGACGVAGSVLAGYPETTFMLVVGAGVLWLAGLVPAVIEAWRSRQARAPLRAGLSLPWILVLGAALSAVQWMPFREAVAQSDRADALDPGFVLRLPFSVLHFLDLALPHIYGKPGYFSFWGGYLGQYWLCHFYVGILTLALACFAGAACLFLRARAGAGADLPAPGFQRANILLAATGGLLAMGAATPVAPLAAVVVPGFAYVKWLPSFTLLLAFALSLLAGTGLDMLLRRFERRAAVPRSLMIGVAAGAALMTLGALLAIAGPAAFDDLVRLIVSGVGVEPQLRYLSPNIGLVSGDMLAAAALLWGFLLVLWGARTGRVRPRLAAAAIVLLVFCDLGIASRGINTVTDPAPYREIPEWTGSLAQRLSPHYRLYVPDETLGVDKWMYGSGDLELYRAASSLMMFNLNLLHGLDSASDGDPIRTRRTLAWHDAVEDPNQDAARARLLSLAGVKVVLQVGQDRKAHLIELRDAMPRAWLVGRSRWVATDTIMGILRGEEWDPYAEVLLEDAEPGDASMPQAGGAPGSVRSIHYTNNTVTLEVAADRESWLVLADTWAPGWRASIDGAPVVVRQANFLFRAVRVPAGEHQVRFEYRPEGVRNGALVSGVGAIGLGGLLLKSRRKRKS